MEPIKRRQLRLVLAAGRRPKFKCGRLQAGSRHTRRLPPRPKGCCDELDHRRRCGDAAGGWSVAVTGLGSMVVVSRENQFSLVTETLTGMVTGEYPERPNVTL